VSERRYGSFRRSFSLPQAVRTEEVTATFRDGILQIQLPKVPEAKPRRIEVRTGA
jgi:HSP20 family protein